MYLKLFSSCKLTKGIHHSIIQDVQRGNYFHIPNSFLDIILRLEKEKIKNIEKDFVGDNKKIFLSYINYLVDNEFGFITNQPHCFSYFDYRQNLKPSINTIIEWSSFFVNNSNFFFQIELIKVEALHINVYSKISLEQISEFLNGLMKLTSIKFVSLLMMFDKSVKEEDLINLGYSYPILGQIHVHSSPLEKEIKNNLITISYKLINISKKSCGIINQSYFSSNSLLYSESHFLNTCLSGKISIDESGNIKNCPSMPQSFGNIKNTTLEKALMDKDFKKYWSVTKDHIEICKDCEFRYICTDCRAYTERSHTNDDGLDISKPLKCGYDPYTGQWHEWSINPLKQKAINFYEMQDLAENK